MGDAVATIIRDEREVDIDCYAGNPLQQISSYYYYIYAQKTLPDRLFDITRKLDFFAIFTFIQTVGNLVREYERKRGVVGRQKQEQKI